MALGWLLNLAFGGSDPGDLVEEESLGLGHARNILHLPGRLCINPTSLSTVFPHGGTALGLVRDLVFLPGIKTHPIVAEEFGGAITEVVYEGTAALFTAVLREWDTDAIETIFPDTFRTSGSTNRRPVARGETDTIPGGRLLSQDAVTLLFSPTLANQTVDRALFTIFHNAIPVIDSRTEIRLQSGQELGIMVSFYAAPNTAGQMWQQGYRGDLVLP